MEPFVTHRGRAAVLDWTDVNTDLIIPARYLKRIERTGYGPLLFADKRTRPAAPRRSTTPSRTGRDGPNSRSNRAGGRRARRSWSSAATSAAAPAASTPSGPSHRPGFRAVIAPGRGEGFADIFEGNAFNNGLLPIELDPRPTGSSSPTPAGPSGRRGDDRPGTVRVTLHAAGEPAFAFDVPEDVAGGCSGLDLSPRPCSRPAIPPTSTARLAGAERA